MSIFKWLYKQQFTLEYEWVIFLNMLYSTWSCILNVFKALWSIKSSLNEEHIYVTISRRVQTFAQKPQSMLHSTVYLWLYFPKPQIPEVLHSLKEKVTD